MNFVRFFSDVYADNGVRLQNRRRLARDLSLYGANRALRPLERVLVARQTGPTPPIGFIVGAPRSGTTLLMQLIARYLEVGYPSNFVARYWMAPLFGTMRFERRFAAARSEIPLRSAFGGTDGPCSPHEFGWFWRFWAGTFETDDLGDTELDRFDWPTLRAEIHALASWLGRPYAFKSLNHVVYNIDRFAREFPTSRFVYIRRDFRYVVQSILECRIARYGTDRLWWTIRPRDVADWLDRSPIDQVCHQVADIRRAIETSLSRLEPSRRLVLDYEDVVAAPREALTRVAELLGAAAPAPRSELERLALPSGNITRLDAATLAEIERKLEEKP
ncbi:MAG: sulfotransferase family protein [Solirubrobacteraceae bacterium]